MNYLVTEQELLKSGINENVIFSNQPIHSPLVKQQVRPIVLPLLATSANRMIKDLHINEIYGPFANVDFTLLGNVDPQIVVPLFRLESESSFGDVLHALSEFNPNDPWTTGDYFFKKLNNNFITVAEEVKNRVRSIHFDYFWQKMTSIIYEPMTWYGKTKFATQRQQLQVEQVLPWGKRRNQIKVKSTIPLKNNHHKQLADLEEQVRSGLVHYTAYEKALQELKYG